MLQMLTEKLDKMYEMTPPPKMCTVQSTEVLSNEEKVVESDVTQSKGVLDDHKSETDAVSMRSNEDKAKGEEWAEQLPSVHKDLAIANHDTSHNIGTRDSLSACSSNVNINVNIHIRNSSNSDDSFNCVNSMKSLHSLNSINSVDSADSNGELLCNEKGAAHVLMANLNVEADHMTMTERGKRDGSVDRNRDDDVEGDMDEEDDCQSHFHSDDSHFQKSHHVSVDYKKQACSNTFVTQTFDSHCPKITSKLLQHPHQPVRRSAAYHRHKHRHQQQHQYQYQYHYQHHKRINCHAMCCSHSDPNQSLKRKRQKMKDTDSYTFDHGYDDCSLDMNDQSYRHCHDNDYTSQGSNNPETDCPNTNSDRTDTKGAGGTHTGNDDCNGSDRTFTRACACGGEEKRTKKDANGNIYCSCDFSSNKKYRRITINTSSSDMLHLQFQRSL
ncbi:hypothetical protein RFI_11130 [Reticulomyxa filosa]|uniref:Uncharacterized protein n=1 Tax=Reticulomyxa filosa TaxID=46433 RepID=X6NJB7_RETFI|nr:hypothetical protein RFI_11130 [Reticulomyxa filosa]|eukprot:ETO26008.1 hypothetical protein RFI_11130 [Reticulomyxa filosa]